MSSSDKPDWTALSAEGDTLYRGDVVRLTNRTLVAWGTYNGFTSRDEFVICAVVNSVGDIDVEPRSAFLSKITHRVLGSNRIATTGRQVSLLRRGSPGSSTIEIEGVQEHGHDGGAGTALSGDDLMKSIRDLCGR